MKQCPRCHAVVRDNYECPFCHQTLTYDDPVMQDKPHSPWNRYTVLYWLRALWFPFVCLIVCSIRLLTLPPPSASFLQFGKEFPLIIIGFTWLLSLVSALLANDPFCENDAFRERWHRYRFSLGMYLLGISAVALSVILFL